LNKQAKPKVYTRYPLSSLIIYNGSTTAHYVLGGIGIILGYSSWVGYLIGGLYLVFSFVQMYVIMPLAVCPNCVYYKMENSLCVSGMNVISKRVAKEGSTKDFPNRAGGLFCHNNVYIAALVIPIIAMIPALALEFSAAVLGILLSVIVLLLLRFFIIFPREACVHCAAKNICPQAEAMGLRESQ
jgi:hypothetical protein